MGTSRGGVEMRREEDGDQKRGCRNQKRKGGRLEERIGTMRQVVENGTEGVGKGTLPDRSNLTGNAFLERLGNA